MGAFALEGFHFLLLADQNYTGFTYRHSDGFSLREIL
jgi:hypothetical protein